MLLVVVERGGRCGEHERGSGWLLLCKQLLEHQLAPHVVRHARFGILLLQMVVVLLLMIILGLLLLLLLLMMMMMVLLLQLLLHSLSHPFL